MAKKTTKKPVRVFVGTSAGGEDAEACMVFEHTLREHASGPVSIEWMALSSDPKSEYFSDPDARKGWATSRWSTPWTAFRWVVPSVCKYKGRAVYFDCPQIIRGDVCELVNQPMGADAIVATRRLPSSVKLSCMVWDCAKAERWLIIDKQDLSLHHQMIRQLIHHPGLVSDLAPGWGLDDSEYGHDPDAATGSIFFANIHIQPHIPHALSRLGKQGRGYWFDGKWLSHYDGDLVAEFEKQHSLALKSGRSVEDYIFSDWGKYAIRGAVRI